MAEETELALTVLAIVRSEIRRLLVEILLTTSWLRLLEELTNKLLVDIRVLWTVPNMAIFVLTRLLEVMLELIRFVLVILEF